MFDITHLVFVFHDIVRFDILNNVLIENLFVIAHLLIKTLKNRVSELKNRYIKYKQNTSTTQVHLVSYYYTDLHKHCKTFSTKQFLYFL